MVPDADEHSESRFAPASRTPRDPALTERKKPMTKATVTAKAFFLFIGDLLVYQLFVSVQVVVSFDPVHVIGLDRYAHEMNISVTYRPRYNHEVRVVAIFGSSSVKSGRR
jgi:hypothetical protein